MAFDLTVYPILVKLILDCKEDDNSYVHTIYRYIYNFESVSFLSENNAVQLFKRVLSRMHINRTVGIFYSK